MSINPRQLFRYAEQVANSAAVRKPGADVFVDTYGIKQSVYAIGIAIMAVDTNIRQLHAQKIGRWIALAREIFYGDIRRPQEEGVRAAGSVPGRGRMTGRFTFGSNGAFKGVMPSPSDNGNTFVMGFPDIPRADIRTERAWRGQEMGAGPRAKPFAGLAHPWHRIPYRSALVPSSAVGGGPRVWRRYATRGFRSVMGGVFVPLSAAGWTKPGKGYEGKHFIERSTKLLRKEIIRAYDQIPRKAFRAH